MPFFNFLTAAGASEVVSGITSAVNSITSEFSIGNIVSIIGIILASVVGLWLFWWGTRKVVRLITNAFKGRSRISI